MLRKVTFMCIYLPHHGGSAYSNAELAKCLMEQGYEVDVVSHLCDGHDKYDRWSRETLGINVNRIPIQETYSGKPPTKEHLDETSMFIRKILRDKCIKGGASDVVVLGHDSWAWYESVVHEFGMPVVQNIKGTPTRAIMNGIFPPEKTDQFLRHVCNADYIVTVADHFKELISSIGFPAEQITTINDGIDTSMFYHNPSDSRLKEELGIDDKKNVIVHASNFCPVKRVCDIVASANKVLKRYSDLIYLFVGEGPDSGKLQKAIRDSPYSDHFRTKEWVPHSEMPDYMNLGDAFVLASESEGYPRVAMEAQACGLHLIASDMPAGRECTLDGEIGTNFRMGDPDDLAEKTLSVLGMEKALFDEINFRAMEYVSSEFDFEKQLSRYIDCIENVCNRAEAAKDVAIASNR